MRIGIDARYAFRSTRRGIGEYVAALIEHLPAAAGPADEFVLYVDGVAEPGALTLPDPRFRLHHLKSSNPLVWEELALPLAAAGDRLDLLHLTSNYGPSLAPCPTVYTIHDLIEFIRPQFGPMDLPFRHAAGRAIRLRTLPGQARRARQIITISEASRRDLVRLLGLDAARICVIPHGVTAPVEEHVDPAEARAWLRSRGWAVPERYVLLLGAWDPRKNGPFAIRAFSRVSAEFPDVELWVVGVERPAEYPVPLSPHPKWLTLHGFVPREALFRLLRGATAFVYPSLYEGFGFPALEAMACGTAVLASNRSSIPEVVGDAGLLFDPVVEEELAVALRRVLSDSGLRASLIRRGRRRLAAFSWCEAVRRTHAVYREAVSGS